jgi:chemotaxis protein methyltransferase CheR
VLSHAREAIYKPNQLEKIPPRLMQQAFTVRRSGSQLRFQVKAPIRNMVDFTRLNLMNQWPMRGPFDAIFCRNVMIYFDKPTQEQLVTRFWSLLAPEGTLFIGHSESLAGIRHLFSYEQPAVYQKRDAPEDE